MPKKEMLTYDITCDKDSKAKSCWLISMQCVFHGSDWLIFLESTMFLLELFCIKACSMKQNINLEMP
jgi:hypothetical protein